MDKKSLLIQVLQKLSPYRDMAEGILALIESGYADEKAIDGVIYVLAKSIKKLKKDQDKTKLQKGLEMIQKIKIMEEKEGMSESDLDKLLADIT